MSRRTKKVGISGRYGVRYGASLRRQARKLEEQAHARYTCPFCGKPHVRRAAAGVWVCRACKKTLAGGAYILATPSATTVRATIRRLRELEEM